MLTHTNTKYSQETVDSLLNLPAPDPDKYGSLWKPIHHGTLAECMVKQAEYHFGRVAKTDLLLSPDKETSIGVIEFPDLSGPDHTPGMFWRHDNKQFRALQLGAGARVWICENGLVSCEYSYRHKHYKKLDLEPWVSGVMDSVKPKLARQARDIWELKNSDMPHAYRTILQLAAEKAITPRVAMRAYDEYRNPRHAEFRSTTRWAWYNAVTDAVKSLAAPRQPAALNAAYQKALVNLN
jgi:hypothetical protein